MLRLTDTLERDLRAGLVLAARSPNPMLAVWADRFRSALQPRRNPQQKQQSQLVLWTTVRDGRPGPWLGRIERDWKFTCITYKCSGISARECVRRQIVTELHRTRDTERGQASEYPACKTGVCEQGTEIRASLRDPPKWIERARFGLRRATSAGRV